MNCLQCCSSRETLTNHSDVCLEIYDKQATKMPEKAVM